MQLSILHTEAEEIETASSPAGSSEIDFFGGFVLEDADAYRE